MSRLFRAPPNWVPYRPRSGYVPSLAAAGTTYTLTAPTPASGAAGVASGNFTVTPNGSITATITPADGGAGGTFTPSSLTYSGSSATQTFTYTPPSSGSTPGTTVVRTISTTNTGGLTDPGSVTYSAIALVRMYFLGDSFTGDSTSSNAISGSFWAQQCLTHLRDDWFDVGYFSAVPGTPIENFLAYSPAPSTFYNAAAPLNVCIVLGGANNFNAGDSAATTYAKLQSLVGTLKGYGNKVLVCSLFSGNIVGGPASLANGDYDILRDTFNVLVRTNWKSFADGFIDFAANAFMGKDGAYANATYFSDQLHPTNTGKTEHLHHAVGPISDVVFPGGAAPSGSGLLSARGFSGGLPA